MNSTETAEVKTKRAKASRRRGKYGEYSLRDYLRSLGWKADRVPCSGSIKSMPGDVTAEKPGIDLLLELKNHSGTFKKIYELYDAHCRTQQDDLLSFVCPGEARLCLSISTSLDALFDGPDYYDFAEKHPLHAKFKQQFKKLAGMQRLLKGSDILVLRDDRKPFLFLRYR